MGILLGFAPYIIFALLANVSVNLGLWLAFAAAFVVTIRDFVESPTVRLLDATSMLVFGILSLFIGFFAPMTSLPIVRLAVELAFFVVAAASCVMRKPLTLDYGHEHVPDEIWNTKAFRGANYLLTTAWTAGFAAMAVADAAAGLFDRLSLPLDLAIGLGVLGLLIVFSVRYPASLATRHDHTNAA